MMTAYFNKHLMTSSNTKMENSISYYGHNWECTYNATIEVRRIRLNQSSDYKTDKRAEADTFCDK